MKKTLSILASCAALAASIVLLGILDASAYKPYYRYRAKPPAWVVPPPQGASAWCKKHPKKCSPRSAKDPAVNTPCEHCMDANGNGDNYLSEWEISTFRKECSVCN